MERALIILSISPMPPLLPRREIKAGGHEHYALGLMAVLALTAIVVVPLEILVLKVVAGRPLEMAFGAVARVVVVSILLPLAAGMAVRAVTPGLVGSDRKAGRPHRQGTVALGLVALLAAAGPAMWQLIGGGTLIAIILFLAWDSPLATCSAGPMPIIPCIALSTACRHPAVALSIAAANFPEERFGATILLCLLLGALAGVPYLAWQRRRTAPRPA